MRDKSFNRRAFLQFGFSGLLGLSGCTQFLENTETVEDTDGDGVIDSEDYAPRDSSVQSYDQVKDGNTTTTEEPTTTTERKTTKQTRATTSRSSTYTLDDLEWRIKTTGDATAQVDTEPLMYEVYKCETATTRTTLGETQLVDINFEYTVTAEEWWENPLLEVYSDGDLVFRGVAGGNVDGEVIFNAKTGGSATGTIDRVVNTGGTTEVVLGLTASPSCGSSDHATTTLQISDLEIDVE